MMDKMSVQLFVYFLLLLHCSLHAALRLGQKCATDADCSDQHATCRPHRCDMKICLCAIGYMINPEIDVCVKASLIGDSCNRTADCLPRHSECNSKNICECKTNFQSTTELFWCVSSAHKALGDSCTSSHECSIGAGCEGAVCTCKRGHGTWSVEERWAGLPQSKYTQCQNLNYTLNLCNGQTVAPPIG